MFKSLPAFGHEVRGNADDITIAGWNWGEVEVLEGKINFSSSDLRLDYKKQLSKRTDNQCGI